MSDKATVIGKAQHPLLNKVIEWLLVTKATVINTALTIFEIVAKHFVFLTSVSSLVILLVNWRLPFLLLLCGFTSCCNGEVGFRLGQSLVASFCRYS